MELSPATILVVKGTASLIQARGDEISKRMYELLFEKYPETKPLFSKSLDKQSGILSTAIAAYAKNIDQIENMHDRLMYISNTHVKSQVREEHYPMVGEALLLAIKEVLGDDASDDVIKAWEEAYNYLSEILLMNEKQLYAFSRVSKEDPIADKSKASTKKVKTSPYQGPVT